LGFEGRKASLGDDRLEHTISIGKNLQQSSSPPAWPILVPQAILHTSAAGRGAFNFSVLQRCHRVYLCSRTALLCTLQPRSIRSRSLGNRGKLYHSRSYSILYEARDRFTVFQPL